MSEQIVELIADDGFTLHQIVNSQFMIDAFANMNWQMPSSPTTLKNMVLEESEKRIANMKSTIQELQENGERFSAIIDEWTSISGIRFMSVTVKSATSAFNLGMARIFGSANAENLKSHLVKRLEMFGIEKLVSISCDGASVMKSLIKKMNCIGQLCLNHGCHLAVKDSFGMSENVVDDNDLQYDDSENEFVDEFINKNYSEVIKKMKKIIGLFNHSAILQEKLFNQEKEDNVPQLKLVTPIAIRWNSIQQACSRLLKVYPQVKKVVTEENLNRSSVFLKHIFVYFNLNIFIDS